MGVNGFFYWITKRYPYIIKRFDDPSRPNFDVLFIDFNSIIYQSLNQHNSNDTNLWFGEICRNLDLIIQKIRPYSLLFISVDGTAPFAKNCVQRQRRKRSNLFRSQISIGTEFMESLHQKLLAFFEYKMNMNDQTWKTPQIVYSSYRTPGEGEHKFFDFVNKMKKQGKWNENAVVCLFSPDPDLLFLCLQTNMINSCLVTYINEYNNFVGLKRENEGKYICNSDFAIIYTNLIKEYLKLEFSEIVENNGNDIAKLIDDFSAISFLIGNDFIPSFCDINPKINEDFSNVVEIYKNYFSGFLVEGTSFNLKNLAFFLDKVADSFNLASNHNMNEVYTNQKEIIENYEINNYSFFKDGKNMLSKAIVESFFFVLKYYKDDVPSWTWQYPSSSAPSLKSVANYILRMSQENEKNINFLNSFIKFEKNSPLSPLEQLISILPSKSAPLVPVCLQNLLVDTEIIENFYEIKEKINEKLHLLNEDEKNRNTLIPPFLFKNNVDIENSEFSNDKIVINSYFPNPLIPSFYYSFFLPKFKYDFISNEPKIEILLISNNQQIDLNEIKKDYLGKNVLVDWPFFKLALVESVRDTKRNVFFHFKEINEISKDNYIFDSNNLELIVRHFQFSDDRESSVELSKEEYIYPFLSVSKDNCEIYKLRFDEKFQNNCSFNNFSSFLEQNEKFPNKPVCLFSLKHKAFCFYPEMKLIESVLPKKSLSNFFENDIKDNWVSISDISSKFNLSYQITENLVSSLEYPFLNTDIGLGIVSKDILKGIEFLAKFDPTLINVQEKDKAVVLSREVIDVIQQFFDLFPFVLTLLQTQNFNENDEVCRNIKEIQNWLKENSPKYKYEMIPLNNTLPSKKVLEYIENLLKNEVTSEIDGDRIEFTNDDDYVWRGKRMKDLEILKCGSRVVVISEEGIIPFGTVATFLSKTKDDKFGIILSDKETPYGDTLDGRLSSLRGFIAPLCDLFVFE